MPLKYALGLASCLGTLVLAKPVSLHANATNSNVSITRLHPVIDYLNLNFDPVHPIDEPSTPPSVTGSEDMHIQCNGASYGFDLSISDCEGANSYVLASADEVQWAVRHTGWQKQFFPLPYRAMGDEASCYVQPVLMDGATSAKASPNHVRNAAAMIRNRCLSGGKLQGGMATNIGGDNNLAVIMGSYKSPSAIRCGHRITSPNACQDILEDMPATTKMEIFGPPHTMSATVSVPQDFTSDDFRCSLDIGSTVNEAPLETLSWYEVWEFTTAMWSMCTRHSFDATISGVGDHGSLLFALTLAPLTFASKAPVALQRSKFYGSSERVVWQR